MSDTAVNDLLAAALQQAADVARSRLEREVNVVACEGLESTAILRFDLSFEQGGKLSWFVANADATGFGDMLIGGAGDRAAAPTEMHLDALTVAFSDMLTRAVDGIAAGLDEPLSAGEIDLGMEGGLPEPEAGGTRVLLALDIAGFGSFPIVQQADAALTHVLAIHAVQQMGAGIPAAVAATPGAVDSNAEAQPATAGPGSDVAAQVGEAESASFDNVVQLPAPAAAAAPATQQRQGDLELLMNVPLPLTVELGRTQRTVRELVDFTVGSIIELGKLAGDPLDIMVNNRVIARGEVVVIDEEFGIRVTEIVSPEDRLQNLA